MAEAADAIPMLARGVRFRRLDGGRGVLLSAKGMVKLDATGCAVVELLDGTRTAERIAADVAERCKDPKDATAGEVRKLLERLSERALVFFSRSETDAGR